MIDYKVGERTIWGPSTVKNEVTETWAKEITKEEIKYLVKSYGKQLIG